MKTIYLAGGCFWGTEHFFKQIAGVEHTRTGFANGNTEHPTYGQVYSDTTGYAETVQVDYDPAKISLEFLLSMFFAAIDPTSLNKQGHDQGTRYRTGIYYTEDSERIVIDRVFNQEQAKYTQPLVVEREPLRNFFPAEDYHQDYLDKHPDGYCHLPKTLFDWARKTRTYQTLIAQIQALISDERDMIANMANISAILHQTFGFWWTGFYRVQGNELILGPFQGPLACTRIPYNKGVCGMAWAQNKTIMVPDVHQFPGHIACSADSRSEIVVPLRRDNQVFAVLDIDSKEYNTFDQIDRYYLEQITLESDAFPIREIR